MKHKEATVLYCNSCRMTTPHTVAGSEHTCKRCGAVKSSDSAKGRRGTHALDAGAESGGLWN